MPTKDHKKFHVATTPEGRETQLENLAMDLAEKQLREGTASSQVISHYLKLASSKEKLEKKMLEKQLELTQAKTEALKSEKKIEELYSNAISAFRIYNGSDGEDDSNGDENI